MDNIKIRFARCVAEFEAIKETKDVNHGQYSYAPLEEVLGTVKPVLKKADLAVRFGSTPEKLQVIIIDMLSGEELIIGEMLYSYINEFADKSSTIYAKGQERKKMPVEHIQALGIALTYSRRYLLVMSLGIITHGEDLDGYSASDSVKIKDKITHKNINKDNNTGKSIITNPDHPIYKKIKEEISLFSDPTNNLRKTLETLLKLPPDEAETRFNNYLKLPQEKEK